MSSTSPTNAGWAGDLGERDQLILDDEPTGHHSVVHDELLEQFGYRGPRPRDPTLGREEAALLLPRKQRLTVVQLKQKVDAHLQRLHGIEQLEPGTGHPPGDRQAIEDVIGEEICTLGCQSRRDAEG